MFALLAMVLCVNANAFKFDGIDLNANQNQIAAEISKKGYVYDAGLGCLKGVCQGTEIFLNLDYKNVSTNGKVGQLTVDIPMNAPATAFINATQLFNVIYHLTGSSVEGNTYLVDEDGTTLTLSQTSQGLRLNYKTPYFKQK